ncbi:MAG: pentapeptide repeat-containing protein [Pleurocapsa minor HA4230-MV1]|jgi:uncharacterized protein YjbI with pentapeptide repeats/DNA-binding MarR family transcriptional regulator|nr:pentapeptide repeat-containing protein [Pleurocapsa minor HA4230-MV1]
MANKEHLALLKQGVEVWNKWRETNRRIEADFGEADLSWIDLSEAILREAILMETNLPGVDLRWIDLSEADLCGVNLGGADLCEVDLRGTNLSRADLSRADLCEADLSGTNLRGADLCEANLNRANLNGADLCEANLNGANLNGADLSEANLSEADLSRRYRRRRYIQTADFRGANLSGLNLSGLNLNGANLSGANLSKANLSEVDLSGANLSKANLSKANLNGADLSGVNLNGADLSGVNLSGVNLSGKDLRGINLSETNLSRIQALETNFERAIFTGACIEYWHTNSKTNLNNAICDFVYLEQDKQKRLPHDPKQNFEPGEFTKIFQEVENTANLIFSYGINWKAFAYAFNEENIQIYNTDGGQLFLRKYKALEDGLIVLKVSVPPGVSKDKVRENLILRYERIISGLEGELKAKNEFLAHVYERLLLPGIQINQTVAKENEMFEPEKILILQEIAENCPIKDSQIASDLNLNIHDVRVILNQLKSSKFIELREHKQSQNPGKSKIDLILVTEITSEGHLALKGKIPLNINTNPSSVVHINSGNFGIGHMNGGEIKDNAKVAGVINEAEQQNLAQAAAEIQHLLEQLSETYPTTTGKERNIVIGKAVDQIENNPTLKAKVINALKAFGIETFKEAVNHPLINILVATIEGWQEAE